MCRKDGKLVTLPVPGESLLVEYISNDPKSKDPIIDVFGVVQGILPLTEANLARSISRGLSQEGGWEDKALSKYTVMPWWLRQVS